MAQMTVPKPQIKTQAEKAHIKFFSLNCIVLFTSFMDTKKTKVAIKSARAASKGREIGKSPMQLFASQHVTSADLDEIAGMKLVISNCVTVTILPPLAMKMEELPWILQIKNYTIHNFPSQRAKEHLNF